MSGHTRQILAEHGLAPSKKRGQNFLVSPATARAIVSKAEFSATDHVVEVGVGLGALTQVLGERVARVTGIEIDRGLISYHRQQQVLPDNVELIHQDILKADFASLREKSGAALKIISNLPYSISNPFIFQLIDNRSLIDKVVVLLQKEMAERLMAEPHSKAYGIPTVLLRSCGKVTPLMEVGADEFYPRPGVDSLLIGISFAGKSLPEQQFGCLRQTVRAAFASRRKTLVNNLLAGFPFPPPYQGDKQEKRECLSRALAVSGLKGDIRAENVTVEQFLELANQLRMITHAD